MVGKLQSSVLLVFFIDSKKNIISILSFSVRKDIEKSTEKVRIKPKKCLIYKK